VIEEAQDGLAIPVPEGLLAGSPPGLLPDEGQQQSQRIPIAGQSVRADLLLGLLFRFTIIWESMIVIMREKRAEVIEIIWERVKPRAA
jgi:hypothetical protein